MARGFKVCNEQTEKLKAEFENKNKELKQIKKQTKEKEGNLKMQQMEDKVTKLKDKIEARERREKKNIAIKTWNLMMKMKR